MNIVKEFIINDKVLGLFRKFKDEVKEESDSEALRRLLEYYNNIKSEYSLNE